MRARVRAWETALSLYHCPISLIKKEKQMIKAGQTAVQERDEAVQAEKVYSQPKRRPGDRAVLVSERSTVFDRPAVIEAETIDPLEGIADPIWDHRNGTVWTPDLVHCRLLDVGATIARLPSPLVRGYVTLLGDAALSDGDTPRRGPPSAAEITLADWTWSELLRRPATQRAILMGMAFDLSLRKMAEKLKVHRRVVTRYYLGERRALAARWIALKHPVDGMAFSRFCDLLATQSIK
jgi:hypothetical protein